MKPIAPAENPAGVFLRFGGITIRKCAAVDNFCLENRENSGKKHTKTAKTQKNRGKINNFG